MYRGIIQHKGFITEYLRDQILSRQLEQPIGRGRIWRVVHDTTQRGPAPALTSDAGGALVDALSHPNGWWRDTAQRLLVERKDASVVAPLKSWRPRARAATYPPARALDARRHWIRLDAATVTQALGDPIARRPDIAPFGLRSAGCATAISPCRRRCSRSRRMPTGQSASSSRHRSASSPRQRGDGARGVPRAQRRAIRRAGRRVERLEGEVKRPFSSACCSRTR